MRWLFIKQFKQKFIFTLLIILITCSIGTVVYASNEKELYENEFTYEEYLRQVELGYIDPELSYQEIIKANSKTFNDLVEEMNSDPRFTLIYESSSFDMDSPEFRAIVNTLNPGDVFIMNSSASWGLSGHAAMALSNSEIINHAGPDTYTDILSRSDFNNLYRYRDIKLYRSKNYYWGVNAAEWADAEYRNNPASYQLSANLASTRPTYCSKIVYQAYKYGAGEESLYLNSTFDLVGPYYLPEFVRIGLHGEYDATT